MPAFTLFAPAKFTEESREEVADEFPAALDVGSRLPSRRTDFQKTHLSFEQKKTPKTHVSFDPEGLRRLRETLKDISFRLAGMSFKVDVKKDAVWIRMTAASHGTQETVALVKAKLLILGHALKMTPAAFRERLESFLRQNGFEI